MAVERRRISDFRESDLVNGQMFIPLLDMAEPNARDRNKRALVERFRQFLKDGIPLSPGRWIEQPMVSEPVVIGTSATVSISGGVAEFNGVQVSYEPDEVTGLPLPGPGLMRHDAVAALEDGSYVYVEGPVSQNPPTPPIPSNSLLVNYVLFNEVGGTVTPPEEYVTDQELLAALAGKADLVNGKVPAEQLPEIGASIESTDDIQTEGVTNLWFTEARAIAARATANLWSYIGLANSTATISLKGWLDFLTNKVKTNEEQIALRVKQVKQGATTYSPDATGLLTLPEPTSGSRIPKTRTTQSGTTINFSQSTTQVRTLTTDTVITSIINPVQGETIRLIITSAGYNFQLPPNVKVLNALSFVIGAAVENYIMLDCVDEVNNKYIATISQ